MADNAKYWRWESRDGVNYAEMGCYMMNGEVLAGYMILLVDY